MKRMISLLLTLSILFGLFSSMSLTAVAEDTPNSFTVNASGINDIAEFLSSYENKADTFDYNSYIAKYYSSISYDLIYGDMEKIQIAENFVNELSSNPVFLSAYGVWKGAAYFNSPDQLIKDKLQKSTFYEAVILKMLDSYYSSDNFIDWISNQSIKSTMSITKSVLSANELDFYDTLVMTHALDTLSDSQIKELKAAAENYISEQGYKKAGKTIGIVSDIISTSKTIEQFVEKLCCYEMLLAVSDSTIEFLESMKESIILSSFPANILDIAPTNEKEERECLLKAINNIIDICSDSFLNTIFVAAEQGVLTFTNLFAKAYVSEKWKGELINLFNVGKLSSGANIISAAKLAISITQTIGNWGFSTDKRLDTYESMKCLITIEKLIKNVLKDKISSFNGSFDDALLIDAGVELLYKTYSLSSDYSLEMLKYNESDWIQFNSKEDQELAKEGINIEKSYFSGHYNIIKPFKSYTCGPSSIAIFLADGSLLICGAGETYDFNTTETPWYSEREKITKVYVSSYITKLGSNILSNLPNVQDYIVCKSDITCNSNCFGYTTAPVIFCNNVYFNGNHSLINNIYIRGNFYCSTSTKSDISIKNGATLQVAGNLEFCTQCPNWLYSGESYLRIDEKAKIEVWGDFLLQGSDAWGHGHYANLYIDGTVNINGNFVTNYSAYRIFSTSDTGYLKIAKDAKMCVWRYSSKDYGKFSAGTIEILGNYDADANGLEFTSVSKVVLSGSEEQTVKNLKANSLIIDNSNGVKYLSDTYVNGLFDTRGNTINNNGFITIVDSTTKFIEGYDYKKIRWKSSVNLYQSLKATIEASGYNITIPKDSNVKIDGDINLSNAKIDICGHLEVTGSINVANASSINNNGSAKIGSVYLDTMNYNASLNSLTNNGTFEIVNKFESCSDTYGNSRTGYRIIQDVDSAVLVVGGEFYANTGDVCNTITKGSVIFNGNSQQNVKNIKAPIMILNNESLGGIVFKSVISSSTLFDHRGNKFTLYNNGSGSSFVDYDGDGLKDNVDPYPTVGNPCTINIKSENIDKGTVSTDKIETVGGTSVSVVATPTSKYNFSRWINASGNTVSTSPKYAFVAKENISLTAVFSKRTQAITKEVSGGEIYAPSKAEIESTVSVSIRENDGYVYTEGTLKYNGNIIKNHQFVMPDEEVVLTAEFVRNDAYFKLTDAIAVAEEYTFESYSDTSFKVFTDVLTKARTALVNHITVEQSQYHIQKLEEAIANLQPKYIVSMDLAATPVLYWNVDSMTDNIRMRVTYDNGTTSIVRGSECTISGFDSRSYNSQDILVNWEGYQTTVTVTVRKRPIGACIMGAIEEQIYQGDGRSYTPQILLTFNRTKEVLIENEDYTVEYSNNAEVGTGYITIKGIGNYEGTRKFSFTIRCEHNYVPEIVAATCCSEGYEIRTCSICGEKYTFTDTITENLPESPHNYSNNSNVTYTYKASEIETNSLTLNFSANTLLETNYDYIYIYDMNDNQIGEYTGSALASKSITVQGNIVHIKLTSNASNTKYGFSLDSIIEEYNKKSIPKLEHDYSEWITDVEPTPDAAGSGHRVCAECGNIETKSMAQIRNLSFAGATLTLYDDLSINYRVAKSLFEVTGYKNPYVVFSLNGEETKVTEYTIDGNYYIFDFSNIAPHQMNDTVFATLYANYEGKEYASNTREYSVATYCYNMLSKCTTDESAKLCTSLESLTSDEYAKLRTLLVDLLRYGEKSQIYKNYKTDNLVSSRLTEEQNKWGTEALPELKSVQDTKYETLENPSVKWKGAGLNLQDSVTMRFMIATESIENLTVKVTSDSGEWTISNDAFEKTEGGYYVFFNGLNAGQMSETVYLTVYNGETKVSNTIRYSIESYAYSMQNSADKELNDLLEAMMKYGKSAYSYLHQSDSEEFGEFF